MKDVTNLGSKTYLLLALTVLLNGCIQISSEKIDHNSVNSLSSSDRRLKENIKPIDSSIEKIMKLEGVEYNYINREKYAAGKQIGLIAQDVQKVFPEVILTDKKTGFLSIAYEHLIAPVIDAIKTLYFRIIGIENRQNILDKQLLAKAEREEVLTLKKDVETKDKKIKELEDRLSKIEKGLSADATGKPSSSQRP